MDRSDEKQRQLYCGNLDARVDEPMLYELFLQAGPLEKVNMPRDREGCSSGYAFIVYKHECSVPYAVELFEDTTLYGRVPKIRANQHHRTQSAPANFASDVPSNQMDYDKLLQMSRDMVANRSHGHNMGMPPPMGGPMMMPAPMGGPGMMMMPSLMGGPYMGMHMPPRLGTGEFNPRGMGPPPHMQMEPLPPGEDSSEDQSYKMEPNGRDMSSLSQSSLQGNWSARNSSHMLPPDDSRRSSHRSRREYHEREDNRYSGHRGNRYNDRYDDGNRSRDNSPSRRDRRERDYREDRSGHYRSRSDNNREMRGRY